MPRGRRAVVTLSALATLTASASLAGLVADLGWPFDLAAHFRVQYVVLLAACAIGLALLGRTWVAAACLALAGANAVFLAPYLSVSSATAAAAAGEPLDVLSLNVFRRSDDYARVVAYVHGERPDVAVFVEATPAWRAGLAPLADVLPYEAYAPGAGSHGILVRSRTPILRAAPLALNGQPQGALGVLLSPHGHPLEVLGVHLEWPMTPRALASRNRELAALADYGARARVPLVAVGDFNASRYTPPFARMLRAGRLGDCAAGTGVHGTWPARIAPAWLQIDQCLHTEGVRVDRFAVGPFVGSDHYPLRVRLRVPGA